MKKLFIFISALFMFLTYGKAQNTSPYWSLAGNSNATASSKLGTTTAVNLGLFTNNVEQMRINTSGLVGIGTTNPLAKLHVNGFGAFGNRVTTLNSPRALNLVDDNAVMRVLRVHATNAPAVELISRTSADGANVAYWDFYTQPSDASFRIRDRQTGANLDRLTINHANGFVGIGTTAPAFALDVRTPNSSFGQFKAAGGFAGVILDKSDVAQNEYVIHRTAGIDKWTEGTMGSDNFRLHNWSTGSAALTVDITNNNVGIPTLSSSAKLNVVGSTTAGIGINTTGYGYGLYSTATYTYGYGVYGSSPYLGVYGSAGAGSYGTYGYSNNIGAYGGGSIYGTYGYSYSGGKAGAYGYGSNGYGVWGESTDNYGAYFTSTNNYALVATTTNAYYAGVFYGHVYASLGYVTSDKNLKKDVHEFGDAMSILNKLKPRDYLFKDDAKYASLHLPKGRHYGLLAQDLEQVLPNLVSEAPHQLIHATKPAAVITPTAEGMPQPIVAETTETKETINIKAVNYVELIPIVVKAMQEQDIKMKEQENEIANLKSEINDLKALILKNGNGSTATSLVGYLKQNTPNPLNNNTVIKYFTPNDTRNAQILVTDVKGSLLKTYKITTGEGQLIIRRGELPSGTYNYTLYVNNNKIDTKQMIIVK